MGDNTEAPVTYNLAAILASSGISDRDLLYIADAVFAAEGSESPQAKAAFKRHGKRPPLLCHLDRALSLRNIEPKLGVKTVTSTIDLLV